MKTVIIAIEIRIRCRKKGSLIRRLNKITNAGMSIMPSPENMKNQILLLKLETVEEIQSKRAHLLVVLFLVQ